MLNRGWWSLNIEGVDELNDADREHLASLIKQGFTSGEVLQEDEEPEEEPDEPESEDYIISSSGYLGSKTSVGLHGEKFLGEYNSQDEAEAAIKEYMEKNHWYPAVWILSDHGNYHRTKI